MDGPEYRATFTVEKDESEWGPHADSTQLGDFAIWSMALALQRRENPIFDVIRLRKQVNGETGCGHSVKVPNFLDYYRLGQDDPEAYDCYKRARVERLRSLAIKKSMGLDYATAAEASWFQQLFNSIEM